MSAYVDAAQSAVLNAARFKKFMNETGGYVTDTGVNRETAQDMLDRKEAELTIEVDAAIVEVHNSRDAAVADVNSAGVSAIGAIDGVLSQAETARDTAISAADAAGVPIAFFFEDEVEAEDRIGEVTNGQWVEVARDGSYAPAPGSRIRYQKVAGEYAFRLNMDQLRVEIADLPSVAALKLRTGSYSNAIRLKAYTLAELDGIDRVYLPDPSDVTTPNNDGDVVVDADGVRWKLLLPFKVFCPEMFGAKTGAADNTAAINALISRLPAGGILDGNGQEYIVTTLLLKSNMCMRNIRFKTKAGATDFVAPVTIDADTTAKENIELIDVYVDGNRQNQTSITSPFEDGGRHGFRIIGLVKNLRMIRCAAVYCAGDGLELFSGNSRPLTDDYEDLAFQDIYMEGCTFDWNRRHGYSVDSVRGFKAISCNGRNNGKDLDNVSALNSGMRGARSGGVLYGRPFDIEGYGIGSAIKDVEIRGGDYTQNIGGILFQDGVDVTDPGFRPRINITLADFLCDATDPATRYGLGFYATGITSTVKTYKNVNCVNIGNGSWLQIHGVDGFSDEGGSRVAAAGGGTAHTVVTSSLDWRTTARANKQGISYDALPATVTRSNVAGTPTVSAEGLALLGFTSNGYLVRYTATLSGSVGTGYISAFAVSAGYRIMPRSIAISLNSTGKMEVAGVRSADNTTLWVGFDLTANTDHRVELIYEVVKHN